MINKPNAINMLGNGGVPFWHVDTLQIRQESRHPSSALFLPSLSLLLPSRPSVSFLVNWIEVTWVRASHKIDVECARLITVIISAVVFSLYFLLACAASQAPLAAPAFSSFSRLFLMAAWLGMFGRFFFFFLCLRKKKEKNYLESDGKTKTNIIIMCARYYTRSSRIYIYSHRKIITHYSALVCSMEFALKV
jgi:hypothetical protein